MSRHTLLVAEREVRERRFIFIAAAMTALMPYLAFILPGGKNVTRADLGNVGIVVSMIFTLALAFIVGASIVGRELAERRLSFYFTRPLPSSAIWFGKLLAAVVLVVAAFALIAVPSVIVSGRGLSSSDAGSWYVTGGWFGILLACIMIGHVASTMVRSRSPRVVIDLVLLVVAGSLAWLIVRPLMAVFAVKAAGYTAIVIGAGVVIAAIAAGAWQLSRGRSDALRSHAALQTFLWPAIAVALVIGAGTMGWVLSAKPSDIEFADAGPITPRWLFLAGKAQHRADYAPMFLIDGQTSEVIRLRAVPQQTVTSRDGRVFGLVTSTSFNRVGGPFELQLMTLGQGSPELLDTNIEVNPSDRTVLSDDGRLLAVIRRSIVSVHDLKDKRLLVSARLPQIPSGHYRMFFPSPRSLRIYELTNVREVHTMRALQLDLATRRLTVTGTIQRQARSFLMTANDDASRLIVTQWAGPEAPVSKTVIDGRTLQPIVALSQNARPFRGGTFLADGRIAVMDRNGDKRTLSVFSAAGQLLSSTALRPAAYWYIAGQAAGNRLVIVESRPNKSGRPDYTTAVVDLQTGRIVREEKSFHAIVGGSNWETDPRQDPVTSDRVWLLRNNNTIWRWDPATGAKTLVVRTALSS